MTGSAEPSRTCPAMEVEDGRHFRNDFDEAAKPADWEVKLRTALEAAKTTVLEAEHRKEGGVKAVRRCGNRRGA